MRIIRYIHKFAISVFYCIVYVSQGKVSYEIHSPSPSSTGYTILNILIILIDNTSLLCYMTEGTVVTTDPSNPSLWSHVLSFFEF